MVAWDQAISTNYFKKKILKQEIESRCRLCEECEETIDHLTSGCPTLAKDLCAVHDGNARFMYTENAIGENVMLAVSAS
jgi:hypothetical protein